MRNEKKKGREGLRRKISKTKKILQQNLKEWVKITKNEEIAINVDGIDINEVFVDEEEGH